MPRSVPPLLRDRRFLRFVLIGIARASHAFRGRHADQREAVAQHLPRREQQRETRRAQRRIVDQEPLGVIVTVKLGGQVLQPEGQRMRRVSWTGLGTFDAATFELSCSAAVVREILIDLQATDHLGSYFENAATGNMVIKAPDNVETRDQFMDWVDATDAWTSSEHLNLLTGKKFYIAGTEVLSGTTLGSGVTGSSLTSVGTIATGVWNGTAIAVANGGTGATDSGTARTNLGLAIGTDVQAYNSTLAAVAGGTYSGDDSITTVGTISAGTWNGTDIAVADGGTGASDAGAARTNLGLAIGTDVQAYNSTLAAVAGGTYSGDDSITTVGTISAGTWNGTAIGATYGGALRYNTSATWTTGESKTITHSLGTKAVQVSLYDSSDAQVFADVVTATNDTLTVTISLAGTYRVVVNG